MKKTRTITNVEEFNVCDLCGKEIDDNNGNFFTVGEKEYLVHLMQFPYKKESCVYTLVADALKRKKK